MHSSARGALHRARWASGVSGQPSGPYAGGFVGAAVQAGGGGGWYAPPGQPWSGTRHAKVTPPWSGYEHSIGVHWSAQSTTSARAPSNVDGHSVTGVWATQMDLRGSKTQAGSCTLQTSWSGLTCRGTTRSHSSTMSRHPARSITHRRSRVHWAGSRIVVHGGNSSSVGAVSEAACCDSPSAVSRCARGVEVRGERVEGTGAVEHPTRSPATRNESEK
jgi:hypothetical protein